jgi:hypothetical protein
MAITFIQGTDCIGDSRTTINSNFSALDTTIDALTILNNTQFATLSSTLQTQQTALTNLSTNVNTLSTGLTTLSASFVTLQNSFNTTNIGPSSTLTTYVSSLSVYSTVGSYIGFIPIYR